jgi:hypothetical protein
VAKNSHIWEPRPAPARKLPIEVRYAPQMPNWRKFIIINLRLIKLFFIGY